MSENVSSDPSSTEAATCEMKSAASARSISVARNASRRTCLSELERVNAARISWTASFASIRLRTGAV
jgi:hypothetical protein